MAGSLLSEDLPAQVEQLACRLGLILALLGLTMARAQPVPGAEPTAPPWQPAPADGYEYKSAGFVCRILPDGRIQDLNAGERRIADEVYVRGDAAVPGAEAERLLLLQRDLREGAPLLYQEQNGTVRLQKRWVLGTVKHPRVAECAVEYGLAPTTISLDYVATPLVALTTHGNMFITHIRLAEAAFAGRGFRAEYRRAGPRLCVFPFLQTKAGALNLGGVSTLRVGMDRDLLRLDAGENSAMRLLDDPGWGGKFSVHVNASGPWFVQPVDQPVGETCRWSIRLSLTDETPVGREDGKRPDNQNQEVR
ncbi:MAG: hypothetical protein A3K19_24360 [Lentisphaerae bacterium RIFOXYB12_FULL_65_16]|nr:MAG: hypothetical protein A3K18_05445 [Lentisphaerae bacterium RIFOXYA12_64_32]OGV90584.1 MAG: hypothetical protein A3K19_24360 [Lentisphaerae bacterium RIFOXYB12_FULL_65_16]